MQRLLKSAKFWTAVFDAAVSILLHFVGGEDVRFVILTIQPLFLAVIAAWCVEDAAQKAGARSPHL